MAMSSMPRFFAAVLPRRWMEAMEADSRRWMVRCACGFARSVWEIGGIRYKATGQPSWFMKCPQCGQRSWHKVSLNSRKDSLPEMTPPIARR